MAKKILITGANGQLGRELLQLAYDSHQYEFHFYGSKLLDLTDPSSISKAFQRDQFSYVINCGAYTKVDHAEENQKLAHSINCKALEHLSKECNKQKAVLIHISSDYVYHSVSDRPIAEKDATSPQGIYAITKLAGENRVQFFCDQWIIIRTSWVYSSYGHNFVKTMLRLGRERDELTIVSDQIGTPTYAKDIATTIMQFINGLNQVDEPNTSTRPNVLLNNIYNFSNEGQTSWDAFAKKIFDLSSIDCEVKSITTEEYGAKAPRPLWSVLSKEKIKTTLGLNIRHWEEALTECLDRLNG